MVAALLCLPVSYTPPVVWGSAVRLEKPLPPILRSPGNVVFAGVRSSPYGIKPFPEPAEWQAAIKAISGYFPGSTPCAVWIVGHFGRPKDCRLGFPGGGKAYPHILFETEDRHERFLSFFDRVGIKVFLQVEPAQADMKTLIDLVLGRYRHHTSVIGFGVDVEWHREYENPQRGVPVDDAAARQWELWVKGHNPGYRLFLKHWDKRWMPVSYRGEIVFVDDSQGFEDMSSAVIEFVSDWAAAFYPNTVVFQVGYRSDRPWWAKLKTPPLELGDALRKRLRQDCGIIWVDFTLRDVLPLDSCMISTASRSTEGKGERPSRYGAPPISRTPRSGTGRPWS